MQPRSTSGVPAAVQKAAASVRATFGSMHLPWEISSMLSVSPFRRRVAGLASGCACVEGVAAFTGPGVGTNGTAKSRNA